MCALAIEHDYYLSLVNLVNFNFMQVRLTWPDPETRKHQTVVLNLPIALGRQKSEMPTQLEGETVTPLLLNDELVSRFHGLLFVENQQTLFRDLSRHGSSINGQPLHKDTCLVRSGDTLKIGLHPIKCEFLSSQPFDLTPNFDTVSPNTIHLSKIYMSAENHPVDSPKLINLNDRRLLTIGRDPINDLHINNPAVSQFHAQIQLVNNEWVLIDLHSTNGTFLNGQRVTGRKILPIDSLIQVGSSILIFQPNQSLAYIPQEGNLRLDAVHLNKVVSNNVYLLRDISLSIKPREFVVIAGVSGGGKSTLLDALNGFRPASSGTMLVNGDRLYNNFDAYRSAIGYVPQKDIIHRTLTVDQTLRYAAELRMPPDTPAGERRQRIEEVLDDLEIRECRHLLVDRLSGGQLKRISMGVELLTKPSLFFLDEATSGLDPGTEREVMGLLRKLADQGRIILLITHATDNVTICDLVVFMAAGGRIAYFGPPKEAPSYFGVQSFNEIYRKVEKEESPQYWQQKYLDSSQHKNYVSDRQSSLQPENISIKSGQRPSTTTAKANTQQVSPWRQFLILTRRNFDIILQDRISLALMLAIAPILGVLDFSIWDRQMFDLNEGDPQQTLTLLSIAVINAIMVGALSSMREIVKERDIFRRERMVCLQLTPYVSSKFVTGVVISLYQAAIFVLFKFLVVDMQWTVMMLGELYITLLLATIGGMTMGLVISALSPNPNVTPLIVILTLIPQITFGGVIVPIDTLPLPGEFLSNVIFSRWGFETVVTITEVAQDIATDPCFQDKTTEERKGMTEKEKEMCKCLGTNLFSQCKFPSIQSYYDPAVNEPEPDQPQKPGKFPTNPADIERYQQSVEDYQTAMDEWMTRYADWSEKRQEAIGKAEGMINQYYDNFGSTFNVPVLKRWGILSGITAVLFLAILLIQRLQHLL